MYISIGALGKGNYTKLDEFLEKCQGGVGGHFQSNNLYCIFGEVYTGLFGHEIDTNNIALFQCH